MNKTHLALAIHLALVFGLSNAHAASNDQCCTNDRHETSDAFDSRRIASARRLRASAHAMKEDSNRLLDQAQALYRGPYAITPLLASNRNEQQPDGPFKYPDRLQIAGRSSSAELQQYDDLYSQYRAAMAAYQQHRQELQQHVDEFHKQAQQGGNSGEPMTINIAPVKALHLQAKDECDQLQAEEQQLHQAEVTLSTFLNDLLVRKSQLSRMDFFQRWSEAQRFAMSIQSQAAQFSQNVAAKQTVTTDELHQITHAAIITGDYTQSAKAYQQVQRRTAIENEENSRANMHSQIADMFIAQLMKLNPTVQGAPTADSINAESQSVAKEFANVQELYQKLEKANPSFAK